MQDRREAAPSEPAAEGFAPEPEVGSPVRSLAHLAEQIARRTPGCCGVAATASASDGPGAADAPGEPVVVTHPDLSTLVEVQQESGEGPIPDALATGQAVGAADLLYDDRWPHYRARALDLGVRSSATLPCERDGQAVTLSVHGFRPRPVEEAVGGATALLGDLTALGLERDRRYREALVQVDQLATALRTRPVIDQACGILMHVLGCDADEAFSLLRQLSQRSNRKMSELAGAVVRTRGRGMEQELRRFRQTP
ncbi:ANTAR domain-containing response regulator [Streptomyces gobiensis]|uniref:ANTAR domain-containing response regulator n=1 Tax=Streptomyces gobiensis TaxID=2875706 RepID=UPI001E4F05B2|nr:ANTAR domain-containing protein [Streptomyces gobiensis]UGY94392.1 ANTAR domain-containing protein [Streptomyces gobiensis]